MEHGGEFFVAGWEPFGGTWEDVESGEGIPLEDYAQDDLSDVSMVTVHYVNDAGDDLYFTLHGPWEDWEGLADAIDDALDGYGVES